MVAPLDIRSRDRPNGTAVADAAVAQWRAVVAALAPIIGSHGVAALYYRSLHLAAKVHPWLAHERGADAPPIDLVALRSLVAGRDAASAAEGSDFLLRTFMELLAGLVGVSLTERLLGPIVAQHLGGKPEQDPST